MTQFKLTITKVILCIKREGFDTGQTNKSHSITVSSLQSLNTWVT